MIEIDDEAFTHCSALTAVDFSGGSPASIRRIGKQAFVSCISLTGITLPDNLTEIDDEAFLRCSSLTGIILPKRLIKLDAGVFGYCTSLAAVTFSGNSLERIERHVFQSCTSLTGITLPDSLQEIGDEAFLSCTSLTTVTFFGNSSANLEKVGMRAFVGCTSLTGIILPGSLKKIDYEAFYGCYSLTALSSSGYNSVNFPAGIEEIGIRAFASCKALSDITLPGSLIEIGDEAFLRCSSLRSVIFSEGSAGIERIGERAFAFCISLTNLTFPDGLKKIEDEAFLSCTSLIDVTFSQNTTASIVGKRAFASCTSLTSVALSCNLNEISDETFISCSSLTAVTFSGYTPVRIGRIGKRAFAFCSSLTDIALPDNLYEIGSEAFIKCTSLPVISLPNNLAALEKGAFSYCSSASGLFIPRSLTAITDSAFFGCQNLSSIILQWPKPNHGTVAATAFGDVPFLSCGIYLPEKKTADFGDFWKNMQIVKDNNFATADYLCRLDVDAKTVALIRRTGNLNANTVSIPSRVEFAGLNFAVAEIGQALFKNGTLTSVTIPGSVTTIGKEAFAYCSSITSITLPDALTHLDTMVFYNAGLTSINISARLTNIGYLAFGGCSNLSTIRLNWSAPAHGSVADSAFQGVSPSAKIRILAENTFAFDYFWHNMPVLDTNDGDELALVNGFYYTLHTADNTASLYRDAYANSRDTITIPSKITFDWQRYDVTKIRHRVFKRSPATVANIPSSIISIGDSAFANNKLEKLYLEWTDPKSVHFGTAAFTSSVPVAIPRNAYVPYDPLKNYQNHSGYGNADNNTWLGFTLNYRTAEVSFSLNVPFSGSINTNERSITDSATTIALGYGRTILTAVLADSRYHFVNWVINGTEAITENPFSLDVQGPVSVIAYFAETDYFLVNALVNDPLFGSVAVKNMDNTDNLSRTFRRNTAAFLIATPQEGFHFVQWTDAAGRIVSQSNIYILDLKNTETREATLRAVFASDKLKLTVMPSDPAYGTVKVTAAPHLYNKPDTLTATPKDNCRFVKWTNENGDTLSLADTLIITLTRDTLLIAHFEKNSDTYTLKLSAGQNGTLAPGTDTVAVHIRNMQVTAQAVPNFGYRFIHWTNANGDIISTDNPYTFPLLKDTELKALFFLNKYSITATATEGGRVTAGQGEYEYGLEVVLKAVADSNYYFAGWTVFGDALVSTDTTYTFTLSYASFAAYTATFKRTGTANDLLPTAGQAQAFYTDGTLHLVRLQGSMVAVTTIDGQRVLQFKAGSDEYPVTLPAGVYILNAASGKGRLVTKFVVR
ncbi:hypothetical protein Barb4_02621 [Bacteroidales bacterium Barb4]|nr:hypothetical protein Barb4_02621 [Bacteroidales bacterium Barb4]